MIGFRCMESKVNIFSFIVIGSAPYNFPGAAFAFSVVWRTGISTTVWTGQCLVREDGQETLLTSWLLRSSVNTCIDKWKSTMIGRDTFTRYEQLSGPRKPDEGKTKVPTKIDKIIHNFGPDVKNQLCNLNGNWYNTLGSEMILKQRADNVIEGEYRTAVERETGAAGNSHSKVFGIGQLGSSNSTFSFFVVWNNGSSVTGWVGQCHICGENKTEIIESTWLLRKRVEKVKDNWSSTLYSEDSFTHTETTPGPRKKDNTHTPDRSVDESPKTCDGCHTPDRSVDESLKTCDGCHPLFSFVLLGLSVLVSLLL